MADLRDVQEGVDVLYTIWQDDSTQCAIHSEDMPLIDRAMKLWADSRRDTWISVRQPSGAELSLLASTITSAVLCTAEQRSAATVREKALDDERIENRRNAGFVDSE